MDANEKSSATFVSFCAAATVSLAIATKRGNSHRKGDSLLCHPCQSIANGIDLQNVASACGSDEGALTLE